jgi:hypothetical protein
MSAENEINTIKSSIWRAIAQSGVDISTIPADKQEILVSRIAEYVSISLNEILQKENPFPEEAIQDLSEEEKVLWEGRPFLSLVETYVITTERLKIIKGFLGRDVEIFELIRLQDIDYKQNLGERIINRGDIFIQGQDASRPKITLRNVENPEKVYEILRKSWLAARKRHGLQFREFM